MNIIKRIINKLLYQIEKKSFTKKKQEHQKYFQDYIIPNIKFGDVILATKYSLDYEDESYEKSDVCAYVVIGIDKDKLMCCYCSQKAENEDYILLTEGYSLISDKPIYVRKKHIEQIDFSTFIKRIVSLNESDKLKLQKLFNTNQNANNNLKNKSLYRKALSERDVIKYNNEYYLVITIIMNII